MGSTFRAVFRNLMKMLTFIKDQPYFTMKNVTYFNSARL